MAKKRFQTCHFKFRYTKIRESILKYDFIKLNKYIYIMWFGGGGGQGIFFCCEQDILEIKIWS